MLQPAARLCLDVTSTQALVHAQNLPQYKWTYRAAEEAGDLAVMRLLRRLSGVEGDWGPEEETGVRGVGVGAMLTAAAEEVGGESEEETDEEEGDGESEEEMDGEAEEGESEEGTDEGEEGAEPGELEGL